MTAGRLIGIEHAVRAASAATALSPQALLHSHTVPVICCSATCSSPWHCLPQVVSEGLLGASRAMAAGRNTSHAHAYLTYPLQYDLFPKDMADLAKANSIRAMSIGYRVLAAMTDMVIGNKQLLQVSVSATGWDPATCGLVDLTRLELYSIFAEQHLVSCARVGGSQHCDRAPAGSPA